MKKTLLAVLVLAMNVSNAFAADDAGRCKLTLHKDSGGWAIFDVLDYAKEIHENVTFDQCVAKAHIALEKKWTETPCIDWRPVIRQIDMGYTGRYGQPVITSGSVCVSRSEVHYTVKKVDYKFMTESEKTKGSVSRND